jgi:hypothetical protein
MMEIITLLDVHDLQTCLVQASLDRLRSRETMEAGGRAYMLSAANSNVQQRSTGTRNMASATMMLTPAQTSMTARYYA